MGKRSDERYKLLASTFGSAAVGTAVIGFIRPEIDNRSSLDPRTIYDPYFSLAVALILLMMGLAWIGGMEDK